MIELTKIGQTQALVDHLYDVYNIPDDMAIKLVANLLCEDIGNHRTKDGKLTVKLFLKSSEELSLMAMEDF